MPNYREDRAWSDGFIPAIKRRVGPLLLEPAAFELDTKEATDLTVLLARDMRIAARIRRPGFAELYPYHFTMRSGRPNGAMTELEKILAGWGDWFFYGHAISDSEIGRWMLVNLHVFRDLFPFENCIPHGIKTNTDGTEFFWFDIQKKDLQKRLLIASSGGPRAAAKNQKSFDDHWAPLGDVANGLVEDLRGKVCA